METHALDTTILCSMFRSCDAMQHVIVYMEVEKSVTIAAST